MLLMENTTTITVQPVYSPLIPQSIILLIVAILSLPCFSFRLYFLLTTRALHKALSNHVIILLLISNGIQTLTDVPVQLAYFSTGISWPPTVSFCLFAYFIDYYLFTTCFLLLTWGSFKQHILIFHSRFFNTPFKRLIGHYYPLAFCCLYPLIYYTFYLLIYPCENSYDQSTASCAPACYLSTSDILAIYEQVAHGFAQIFLTCIFNLFLLIGVLHQKHRVRQQISWIKSWRMMVQSRGICVLLLATRD